MEIDLFQLLQGIFFAWFATFLRVSSFLFLVPGLGEQSVPSRVKIALSAAISLAVYPVVDDLYGSHHFYQILATEVFSGVFLGLALRMLIIGLQTAGSIAAQSTSLAQLFGSSAGEPMPAIGNLLIVSGITLFLLSDLHLKAIQFILLSYDILPPGTLPNPSAFSEWGISRVAYAFELAFVLAAPFVILSAVYNLALGAINRAMPQLMVAFVGAPLITAGGLILLLITAPIMLSVWRNTVSGFLENPMYGIN